MTRYLFRVCLVHTCYSPELSELKPKKCRCRRLISREDANRLVAMGTAEWVTGLDMIPTWDIAMTGRTGKTPRAATIEKAHIERAFGGEISDDGAWARKVESSLDDDGLNEREDIEIDGLITLESRIQLFGDAARPLCELKSFSDKLNKSPLDHLSGKIAEKLDKYLTARADEIKQEVVTPDPIAGEPVLLYIGSDQRTKS